MEALAENVIGLLGSLAAKELDLLCNFQDDLETMKRKVTGIRKLLHDAERKATKSEAIKDWLQKLRDMLLDAEDLLDAYSAEELAREVMTKDKMVKEVRIFFSKSNRIFCAHKMGCKIRAIRKKLDEIYDEKNPFLLHQSSSSALNESHEWRRTDPFVSEQDVIGRDEERIHLVSILLNPDVKNDVSVIPVVGIGGSGKTTLVQQVYNDVAVKNHFEVMMWLCVSDESDALSNNMLAQKIIEQETLAKVHQPAQELRHKIEGKLFLLVLDDVWNIKDRGEWLKLENLFRAGRKGSMIVVTTRSMDVANTMGTHPSLSLKDLDEGHSWELFCRVAFRDGKEPDDHKLVWIGKDIVRKCAGVPLAIRTIGSLLFNEELKVSEWSYFRDNELATIDSDDNKIFSILKLSYDHLPFHLKNCFAFCSLFPKDYEIERKTLIQLWIAEGFIQPLDKNTCLEDVGDRYFKQLLSRCLFQDVRRDFFGDIGWCKMHDLIHDLAQSITKNECYIVTSERIEKENFGDGIRHMSCHFDGACKFPSGNVKTKKLRTLLSLQGQWEFIPSHSLSRFFYPICRSTTSLPKHLRVLVLIYQELEIPENIGDLKHLRHLDLSNNEALKELPQGITKLHNLLTLKLNGCRFLIKLPGDLKRLVRLRHLELDYCERLICMPSGLDCLINLQTLTRFVVVEVSGGGARISELRDLICLRGSLAITNLRRQRRHVKEVESSKFLLGMSSLVQLNLCWTTYPYEIGEIYEHDEDEIILEALEPPHTIKVLYIYGFCGKWFSEWIWSLTSLQKLIFYDCSSLISLPESIGNLTSLQYLEISNCTSLVSIPESIGRLTSLQTLSFWDCIALASLPDSIKSLTSLQRFDVRGCSALKERYGQNLEGVDWPGLAHILFRW